VADLQCILEDEDKGQKTGVVSLEDSCDEEQLDTNSYNQASSVDAAAVPVRLRQQ
jgi:hypothetical protein